MAKKGSMAAKLTLIALLPLAEGSLLPLRQLVNKVFHSITSNCTSKKHCLSDCCTNSFMGSGCIWPEPEAEKPAWLISAWAALTSYLMSNAGLPHQGWPGGTVPLGMAIMPPSICLRPSRSTHRLAAWRTRLSSQGEPSANDSCQGHTWGWALL